MQTAAERSVPVPHCPQTAPSTLNKVVKALSLAGIEFVTRDDGAIGVMLKGEQVQSRT